MADTIQKEREARAGDVCTCGHTRAGHVEHKNFTNGGACLDIECPCIDFTFHSLAPGKTLYAVRGSRSDIIEIFAAKPEFGFDPNFGAGVWSLTDEDRNIGSVSECCADGFFKTTGIDVTEGECVTFTFHATDREEEYF
ncbi:MAG: hypothetical protein H0W63_03995 [Gemmatimonadaceae bacterium]|nr:hypothetical protein [Gemmatimonadaceae bacterium]